MTEEKPDDVVERCAAAMHQRNLQECKLPIGTWYRLSSDLREWYRNMVTAVIDAAGVERLREERADARASEDNAIAAMAREQERAEKAERELAEAERERDEALRQQRSLLRKVDESTRERDEWKRRADVANDILSAIDALVGIEDTEFAELPGIVERTRDKCEEQAQRFAAYEKVAEAARSYVRSACSYQSLVTLLESLDALPPKASAPSSVKRGLESAAQATTSARVTAEDEGVWIPEPAESPEQAAERRHRELLQAIWECTRKSYDPNGDGYLGGVDYVEGVQRRARERR